MLEPVSPGQTNQDGDGEKQPLEPMSQMEYQQQVMESAAGGIRLRDDYPSGMPRFEAKSEADKGASPGASPGADDEQSPDQREAA